MPALKLGPQLFSEKAFWFIFKYDCIINLIPLFLSNILVISFNFSLHLRYISPLLAAIIPWSSIGRKDTSAVCRELAPLVDKGYFSTEEILLELLEYTSWGNPSDVSLLNLKQFGISLIPMLFGQSMCMLRQLASRMFIDGMYAGEAFGRLSSNEVACLVRRHSLPTELITDFQIVLLRHKILNALAETDWDLWDVEEFTLDVSSEYDESDDEYW